MHLGNFPSEVIREILCHCDLTSLVWLNATFDARITKVLRSPLYALDLDIYQLPNQHHGPLRYLLSSIRDVRRLELRGMLELPSSFLPLLSTLNPLELALTSNFMHPSFQSLEVRAIQHPQDPSIARTMALMKPFGFPHLPILTPRLHTLDARHGLRAVLVMGSWGEGPRLEDIELPSTLTSLSLCLVTFNPATISLLPTGLKFLDLECKNHHSILAIFGHLPSLESLIFRCEEADAFSDMPHKENERAPASLTSLLWDGYSFPLFLFTEPLLEHCSLLNRFEAQTGHFPRIYPRKLFFPNSIRFLKFRLLDEHVPFLVLPTSLTELVLERHFLSQRVLDDLLTQFSPSVSKVTLRDPRDAYPPLSFVKVPSNLKVLRLEITRALRPAEIETIPSTLKELQVAELEPPALY